MPSAKVSISFDVKDITKRMEGLKNSIKNKILRKALTKTAQHFVKAVKNEIKLQKLIETKSLLFSYGSVVRSVRGRAKSYAVMGPMLGKTKSKKKRPWLTIHNVEFGHGGPAPAPPHPFVRPVLAREKPAMYRIMRIWLWNGIQESLK